MALPVGPPARFGADGATTPRCTTPARSGARCCGSATRRCSHDTGRLTFAEAQQRMTRLPGRRLQADAERADARSRRATRCSPPPAANDPADFAAFWAGVRQARRRRGRRGAGSLRRPTTPAWSRATSSAATWRSWAPRWRTDDLFVRRRRLHRQRRARRAVGHRAQRGLDHAHRDPGDRHVRGSGRDVPGGQHGDGPRDGRARERGDRRCRCGWTRARERCSPSRSRRTIPAWSWPARASASSTRRAGGRGAQPRPTSPSTPPPTLDLHRRRRTALGWQRVEFGPGDIRLFGGDPSMYADASVMTPPMPIGGLADFRLTSSTPTARVLVRRRRDRDLDRRRRRTGPTWARTSPRAATYRRHAAGQPAVPAARPGPASARGIRR